MSDMGSVTLRGVTPLEGNEETWEVAFTAPPGGMIGQLADYIRSGTIVEITLKVRSNTPPPDIQWWRTAPNRANLMVINDQCDVRDGEGRNWGKPNIRRGDTSLQFWGWRNFGGKTEVMVLASTETYPTGLYVDVTDVALR